jgi:glycosyltransferase involved in cell wall biosynthesis
MTFADGDPMLDTCIQINLQRGFGGGEVYAAAFCRALQQIGIAPVLYVHPAARAWSALSMAGVRLETVADAAELIGRLKAQPPRWLVFHTFAPAAVIEVLRGDGHLSTAVAHMPLYGRDPRPLRAFDEVMAVSRHVIASLDAAGIAPVYAEPLYGIADLRRAGDPNAMLRRRSRFDWDRRKVRDRLLGALEPLWQPALSGRPFERRGGLTLGIVSRLTPIKQFPLLFSHLAPVLARYPSVHLEIFGSGGYASVRDLVQALQPMRGQVRFWGHQANVGAVYRQIDFLLTGLPEKEALGLNVIEAQACGTPVLAPDAPPFDETVLDGVTGLRYCDPRADRGADFEHSLQRILAGEFRFDAEAAQAHLAQFYEAAFVHRVRHLVEHIAGRLAAGSRVTAPAP